jgi:hypothetical protein
MNNILLLQIEDRENDFLQKLMMQNKQICSKNNINYVNLKKSSYNVPPYWGKVFEIYKIMIERPELSYIIWLDSDAVFYNFNQNKLINLLNDNIDYSFIMSKDMPPWENGDFNAGSFIVKNDKIGLEIINKWMKMYNPDKWIYFNKKWLAESDWAGEYYEQGAFIKHIYKNKKYFQYIKQLPFYILNNNNCSDNNPNIIVSHLAGHHKKNQVNIYNCLQSFKYNDDNIISFLIVLIILLLLIRFYYQT